MAYDMFMFSYLVTLHAPHAPEQCPKRLGIDKMIYFDTTTTSTTSTKLQSEAPPLFLFLWRDWRHDNADDDER